MKSTRDLYLDTLRDFLTGELYGDTMVPRRSIRRILSLFGIKLGKMPKHDQLSSGRAWPQTALTMVGKKRLNNIRKLLSECDSDGVLGDFVECGVWRGGASIYAAAVIATSFRKRDVWLCDSFQGLPNPTHKLDRMDPVHLWKDSDVLAVPLSEVQDNFKKLNLLGPNIHFVKGWFKDTLSELPCKRIAVLRADGDMYESTMQILGLWRKVSPGGYVIIDDYYDVQGCRKAVDSFFHLYPDLRPIRIDDASIYFQKPS